MKFIFQSSIVRGGSVLTPQIIEIDDYNVVFKQKSTYLYGMKTISIPRNKVSSVEIKAGLISSDIIIHSMGAGIIHLRNFSNEDANEINDILMTK